MYEDTFSQTLLEHFRNPRNAGVVESPDAEGVAESSLHQDWLRLTFRLERGRIREVKFQCRGCSVAIAAGSVATELLRDRSPEEARALTNDAVAEALGGVPPSRRACSLLVAQAVRAAFPD